MRLYMVTRSDLSAAQQAIQAAHSLAAWLRHNHSRATYQNPETLVLLSVPDEPALKALQEDLGRVGVVATGFQEPDLNHSLTAITCPESAKRHLRHLPLALSAC